MTTLVTDMIYEDGTWRSADKVPANAWVYSALPGLDPSKGEWILVIKYGDTPRPPQEPK